MKTILKTVCLFALLCIFSTTFAQIEVQFDTPIQVPITTADPTQAGAAYNFVMSFPDERLLLSSLLQSFDLFSLYRIIC